ncbi:disease resistance protein At4g27190-like [Cornus florida]|uniref:disease resistance protein At4g27190-like n=1 Tax=Cornus florida TaxID=4283 RepID=UPI00289A8C77|nr:disease resistance protein At4g27190-like [Cornus florida]
MFDLNRYIGKSDHFKQLNTYRLHVGGYLYEYQVAVYAYEKKAVLTNCCLYRLLVLPDIISHLEIHSCHIYNLQLCGVEKERHCAPLGVTATPPGTLSNLKELEISMCQKMKKLLTPRMLENLPNLETIRVEHCYKMEEIIGDEEDELMGTSNNHPSSSSSSSSSSSTIFTLPNLRLLELYYLLELESICKGLMVCDSLEIICIRVCRELKRLPLSLPLVHGQPSPPAALKKIQISKAEEEWWESLEWDHPNAKDVLQPFLDWF